MLCEPIYIYLCTGGFQQAFFAATPGRVGEDGAETDPRPMIPERPPATAAAPSEGGDRRGFALPHTHPTLLSLKHQSFFKKT